MLRFHSASASLAIALTFMIAPMAGCDGESPDRCGNDVCRAGQVCTEGVCETICDSDADCRADEHCGASAMCEPGARLEAPRISSIDGDGTADTNPDQAAHHIASGLVIAGTELDGATFALLDDAGGTPVSLVVRITSDERAEVTLPLDLTPGSYTLTATNAVGSDQATITILQGEPGQDGAPGEAGAQGEQGAQGPPGAAGSDATVTGDAVMLALEGYTGRDNISVDLLPVGTVPDTVAPGDHIHPGLIESLTQAELDVYMPAAGTTAFNTNSGCLSFWNGSNWYESCGECTPRPVAVAGSRIISPSTNVTLAALTPAYGTGIWNIQNGAGGTFADTADPQSLFTGLRGELYTLRWTVTTTCGSGSDDLDVVVQYGPCPNMLPLIYGGVTYLAIQVGNQCWMGKNLNYGVRVDTDQLLTDNGVAEKYCYGDDPADCNVNGAHYTWDELMQYTSTAGAKGLCPPGWHIPTDAEWNTLVTTIGGTGMGKRLQAPNNDCAGGACTERGFTRFDALLAGQAMWNGGPHSSQRDSQGTFWTSTLGTGGTRIFHRVSKYNSDIQASQALPGFGFSVRCLKD